MRETGSKSLAAAKKSGAASKPAITTLSEYFSGTKPAAKRFLRDLARSKIGRFQDDDVERVTAGIEKTDPLFSFTHELAYAAIRSPNASAQRICMGAVGTVLNSAVFLRVGWYPTPDISAAKDYSRILQKLGPMPKDKLGSRRHMALVLTSAIWLQHTRGLDFVDVVSSLPESIKNTVRKAANEEFALLVKPGQQARGFSQLARSFDRCLERALEEKRRTDDLQSRLAETQERGATLASELEQARNTIKECQCEAEKTKSKFSELQEHFRVELLHRANEVDEVKGRIRVFFEKRMRSILDGARDAISVDPPALAVVTERLDLAVDAIKGEVEWLSAE